MKKILALSLILLFLTVFISGCGSQNKDAQNEGTKENSQDKITIKISYGNNPGEPVDKAVHEWGRLVKEKTNGRVEFEYYPSSQLGSQKDVTEQAMLGGNIIVITDSGWLADYIPDFAILSGPYLVDNDEQLIKLVDSDWFKGLSKQLEDRGLYIVHTKWIYGTRHMIATKPFTKPGELKGLKIRVPSAKMSIEIINAMGGTATPMPLADTYPALMQGIINGAENPTSVLYGSKMHEGAKYLMLTGHQTIVSQWVAGTKFIEKLPPDIVKIISECGDEAAEYLKQQNEAYEKESIDQMKKAGVQIIEVDREAFKNATKGVYSKFPEWSPNLYEKVESIIKDKK